MLSLKSVQQSRAILRLVQEVGLLREALTEQNGQVDTSEASERFGRRENS